MVGVKMVRTAVDFIFDFGSPNAYLAHKLILGVEARVGAIINYIPCLLGGIFKATGNQSPMTAYAGIKNKLDYEMLEMRRFVDRHRIMFEMNPYFPVNTLMIMRGAVAAKAIDDAREKLGAKYINAVFDGMWVTQRNMADPETVLAVLEEHGLDGGRILAMVQSPEIKEKLIENTDAAVARGVFGAPTFFIGDEMWFGKDRLGAVEAAAAK